MARIARVVVPGLPHHVTQRGNRGQATFLDDDDYAAYLGLLAEELAPREVGLWAYCLMPNHVHLILVPATGTGLADGLGEAHRRYTRRVNLREGWRGYLWQGRFASFPLDEGHLWAATRYVELNPVRARLVQRPEDWPWSSARAHLEGRDAGPLLVRPLLERFGDWRAFLDEGLADKETDILRRHERTGRPLGSADFVKDLESRTGRTLARGKRGPKARKD